MPTYEFTCPNGHDFEKFFRTISSGESELPCPICGAISTRKISAGAGLMFKGSGFYITDYGKDGKKDQNLPRKTANGESGSSSSSSSDSGSGGGDSKSSSDSKSSGDSKSSSSDSKSGESKSPSSDSKSSSSDSKPAAAKPAESKPSAPKSSNSSE
jgi:putative FmdB family regulatory protein